MSAPTDTTPPVNRLWVNRPKAYPADVHGPWRRIKWAALVALLAVYYITPWIRWDRGPGIPDQAVLVDMVGRRLYFFWIEIWPQEIYYLTGLLILGALGIFFATTLFGRVWCGYACPQTVWTDLFMWVERWIEGNRAERIRLDKAPWTGSKAVRKIAKHGAWILISLLTGGAWIFYFNDAPTLMGELLRGEASAQVLAFIGLFTATTYVLAGWSREQTCIYMCPWRSFQSAMLDEDSYVVTYQSWRGDTPHPIHKSQSWEERTAQGYGDCIDCKLCLHVCPTGTDIRKGQQISCIGCGLCIDACNEIMRQIGRPGNLVLFDTESNQVAKSQGRQAPVRIIRPRTVVYALVMLAVAGLMLLSLATRATIGMDVLRDRAPLYVARTDGTIQNAYTFKILNMAPESRVFRLSVAGLSGARITGAGLEGATAPTIDLPAERDSVTTYRLFVRAPANAVKSGSTDVTFTLTDTASGEVADYATVFIGP